MINVIKVNLLRIKLTKLFDPIRISKLNVPILTIITEIQHFA